MFLNQNDYIGELSMQRLLEQTPILDYYHPSIQNLIEQRKWRDLDEVNKVRNIYNFVRDEVQFGYNTGDTIQASQVLSDGYGRCNTKATLLMALLRAVGVAMRMGLPSIKPYKKAQSKAFGISYRPIIFYIVGSKFM